MDNLVIDKDDYKKLLYAVFKASHDDYIKLFAKKFRKKKYLQEAWEHSVDLFFDSEFRFLYFKNDFGDFMSLQEMLQVLMETDRFDIEDLQKYLIDKTKEFWDNKIINIINIPNDIVYDGHIYEIHHHDSPDYEIDFIEKKLLINKDTSNSDNQETFMQAVLEVMLYHENIPISKKHIPVLGKALFRLLKVNSCFLD